MIKRLQGFATVTLLATTLLCSVSVQAEAIRALTTYAAQSSADLLSPVISSDARHLYTGDSASAQISQFELDASGAVALKTTFDLSLQSSVLQQATFLQLSSSGSDLYVAGQFNISRLSRDSISGALTLLQELPVDPLQPIVSLTLSPDQRDLYVITTNGLHQYSIRSTDGQLELAAVRTTTTNAYNRLLFSNNEQGFIERDESVDSIRRDPLTGSLTTSSSITGLPRLSDAPSPARGALQSTKSGDWLYVVRSGTLFVYSVDPQTGVFALRQQINEMTPGIEELLFSTQNMLFNQNETRLLVTGWLLIQRTTSTGTLTSFVRDPQTGLLTFEEPGPVPASTLLLHPFEDWFYALRGGIPSTLGLFPARVSQLELNPSPLEARVISAVLPNSRVQTNSNTRTGPVSAFATVLNPSTVDASNCNAILARDRTNGITLTSTVTDPVTNEPLQGTQGAFSVPAGGSTTLLFSLLAEGSENRLTEQTELLDLRFSCANALVSRRVTGVTTFGFAVSDGELPDLPTAVTTLNTPGVVELPQQSGSLFVVSTTNIGGTAFIRAEPALQLGGIVTGVAEIDGLPDLELQICETNPATAICLSSPTPFVDRTIETDEVVTFNVFVSSNDGNVAFNPERNRVHVLFREGSDGPVRGGSSVAVRTQ